MHPIRNPNSLGPLRPLARTLALAAAAGPIVAPVAVAGDWYVDASASNCATATGGPSAPFCTIGDALAVAVNGDTIHVAAGKYAEHFVVTADVALVGTSEIGRAAC